ncbi:MAG: hypothetical protein ACR2QE_09735 [Acidimicrobiales bacterium]
MAIPRRILAAGLIAVAVSACVPTLDERLTIEETGAGELSVTWFVTRDGFEEGGFLDAGNDLADLEWGELQDLMRRTEPEEAVASLAAGVDQYEAPEGATLETFVMDDQVGLRYRERFASLDELESWGRVVGAGDEGDADLGGPVDTSTGRLSMIALWGIDVVETETTITLSIDAASAWLSPLAEFGTDEPTGDGVNLRLVVSVAGNVTDHNADGLDGDLHLWEPTYGVMSATQLRAAEPLTISWEPDQEPDRTRLIALGLVGVGGLIGAVHLLRFWRS